MPTSIVLAGCGKMGGALLSGWLEKGVGPECVTVVEPNPETRKAISESHPVNVISDPGEIVSSFFPAIVVFAVKPQIMDEVAPSYARFAGPGCVFLSIAAGRTIAFFQHHLGPGAAIVRSMPNTPAAVGRGATVAVANPLVTDEQHRLCQDLLEAVGEVAWTGDEDLLDAVTALSGSGPAYVFLLTECMAEAGIEAGLPEDLARRLAMLTVSGAGELMRLSEDGPKALRENVTSPGGTTAAALDVLMEGDGLKELMTRAVLAAARRSKELAG
ncbi:MAG: pyrroline-5-carboxylate reductase [Rhodospirillales bacterium]